jgi:hypothetical protein
LFDYLSGPAVADCQVFDDDDDAITFLLVRKV